MNIKQSKPEYKVEINLEIASKQEIENGVQQVLGKLVSTCPRVTDYGLDRPSSVSSSPSYPIIEANAKLIDRWIDVVIDGCQNVNQEQEELKNTRELLFLLAEDTNPFNLDPYLALTLATLRKRLEVS